MKSSCFALYFIALMMCSCKWGVPGKKNEAVTKDTLKYAYKVIKEKAADCKNVTDNGCNMAKFTYPVFQRSKNLQDSIIYKLAATFQPVNNDGTNFAAIAKNFFGNYSIPSSNDYRKPPFFPLNEYAKIVRQDSALITIEVGGYVLQSNQPFSHISFINWDTKADKKITLDDLFKPGYRDSLNSIGETIFRSNERLGDTTSLAKNYFFKGNKFSLNNNYLLTPTGIRFLYNEYEIKPRGAGLTLLIIPYSKIKALLKPRTIVAQYVK